MTRKKFFEFDPTERPVSVGSAAANSHKNPLPTERKAKPSPVDAVEQPSRNSSVHK